MDRVDADFLVVSHIFPLTKIRELQGIAPRYDFKLLIPNGGDELEL